MATTAQIQPIEYNLTTTEWTNITAGSTAMDGKKVLVQSKSGSMLEIEKESSATPNTYGTGLSKYNDALPLFTKKLGFDIWAKGVGVVRVEVYE